MSGPATAKAFPHPAITLQRLRHGQSNSYKAAVRVGTQEHTNSLLRPQASLPTQKQCVAQKKKSCCAHTQTQHAHVRPPASPFLCMSQSSPPLIHVRLHVQVIDVPALIKILSPHAHLYVQSPQRKPENRDGPRVDPDSSSEVVLPIAGTRLDGSQVVGAYQQHNDFGLESGGYLPVH